MTTILLYDSIETGTAKAVRQQLAAAGKGEVNVRIHSPGGSVFAGMAIHAALTAHPGRVIVHVDGVAASIASVIAMAGDEIRIAQNGFMLVHDPSMTIEGGAEDLRAAAELVDKARAQVVDVYQKRTKADRETIARLMQAEAWLDSAESLRLGFADKIVGAQRVAAAWQPSNYFTDPPFTENQPMTPATIQELRAALPGATPDFLLAQIEAGATMDQARAAWLDKREADLAARERAGKKQTIGVNGLADRTGSRRAPAGDADPDEFARLVDEQIEKGLPRLNAVAAIGRQRPDLHHAFVASHNRPGRVQELIAERFDQ